MSYRVDLTERLISLVFLLARRPHLRQELAQEFGVDAKTISKDIAALTREYPIEQIRRGREVSYSFPDNYQYQIPGLTPEEVATLLLAQEAIANVGITAKHSPFAGFADSLLSKIRAALPFSVRRRMETLATVYGSAAVPAKNFAFHTQTIDRLASAATGTKRVEIIYDGLNRRAEEKRIIEPYAVYFDPDGATLKLIARDLKRREMRVFSIDRVRSVKIMEEKFTRQPDFNLREYLSANCFNGIHGAPVTVQLRAKGVTARIFAERTFHPSQKIVKRVRTRNGAGDSTTIEMRVAGGRGLVRFILSYLPEIEVISPPELQAEIKQILEQSLAKRKSV